MLRLNGWSSFYLSLILCTYLLLTGGIHHNCFKITTASDSGERLNARLIQTELILFDLIVKIGFKVAYLHPSPGFALSRFKEDPAAILIRR
jgi:hypothetical protein